MLGPGELIWKLQWKVVGCIVNENLNLHDISRLEVACCSHSERPLFLGALRSSWILSEVSTAVKGLLSWILKRGIQVGTLKVESIEDTEVFSSVVNSLQQFKTMHLRLRTREFSKLENTPQILRELEPKVSSLSNRQLATDGSFTGIATFCGLVSFEAGLRYQPPEWMTKVISQNAQLQAINVVMRTPLSADFFVVLSTRQGSLKKLTLLVASDALDSVFVQDANSCPNLHSLALGGYTADMRKEHRISQGIVSIAEGCPELRELKLLNCTLWDHAANEKILRGLRYLGVLDVLSAEMLLSDALLKALAERCSGALPLTELKVIWNVLRVDTVAQAAVALVSVRHLVLHTTYPHPPPEPLQAALALLPQLQDLTLQQFASPLSPLLSAVAQGSRKLRSISVMGNCMGSAETGLI
jgi:hypothetical protein